MDWFERLVGFRETGYADTKAKLEVLSDRLCSKVNGQTYAAGRLELPSLAELRQRIVADRRPTGALSVEEVVGDVRRMHREPENESGLFQVASQFNMLEMTGPSVTPEQGVTRYAFDPTQGPACAQAAGAATIYRNYFAPVGRQEGQTTAQQLDGLADLGAALSAALGRPVENLWSMRNGYALCTPHGLAAIGEHLNGLSQPARDDLRGRLRIGLHWDVEVTDGPSLGPLVSQAFCSALPVRYGGSPQPDWRPFAELVLEAAYEATLWAGALNARRGGSNVVLLTRLGGGAFGNDDRWIDAALTRALSLAERYALRVKLVSYGRPRF